MKVVKRVLSAIELNEIWPQIEPMFTRCASHSHNPVTSAEIHRQVANRESDIFYIQDTETGKIFTVMAVQPMDTARGMVYFVLSLGGEDLGTAHEFFKEICVWMKLNGAVAVEGMVRPAMLRALKKYGWKPICTQVRFEIKE